MKKRGYRSEPDCGDMLAMSFSAIQPTGITRDEALAERIAKVQETDPMEAHFMRLAETEQRNKPKVLQYWE